LENFPKDFLYFIGQVIAPVSGISGTDISARLTGSFNNMGVPGANSSDMMEPTYGDSADSRC
jgi:hypothetical protein